MGHKATPSFDCDRRCFERVAVEGAAAVLDFGYLGTVYAIEDLSLGGARLIGPRRPPDASFEILLHVSNFYLECRARQVWDDRARDGSLGIEFENIDMRSSLDWSWTQDEEPGEDSTSLPQEWNRNAEPALGSLRTTRQKGIEENRKLAWRRQSEVLVALRQIFNISESVQV